jgi:hypothetical protein
MTDAQLDVLRHMLGINDPWHAEPKPHRDYYCANPGDPVLHELARLGAVRLYSPRGRYEWFTTTEAGRAAALASYSKIQKPKGARVYARFLDTCDVWPELTFREFLVRPVFAEARRAA